MMAVISFLLFLLIQLPPGDYVTTYVDRLETEGLSVHQAEIDSLREMYGLDKPFLTQYFKWISNFLRGRLGRSFSSNMLVRDLLIQRLPISITISLSSMIFVYVLAIPIGIYSATNQYSAGDYLFTVVGFFGLAVPNFLFALVLMYMTYRLTGHAMTGLFNQEFLAASWSIPKFANLLKNIWLPVVVLGTGGTAGLIRVTRGNLLDELKNGWHCPRLTVKFRRQTLR